MCVWFGSVMCLGNVGKPQRLLASQGCRDVEYQTNVICLTNVALLLIWIFLLAFAH